MFTIFKTALHFCMQVLREVLSAVIQADASVCAFYVNASTGHEGSPRCTVLLLGPLPRRVLGRKALLPVSQRVQLKS